MKANSIITIIPLLLICLSFTACNKQEEMHPLRKSLQQAVFASGHLEQENEYVIASTADGIIRELNIHEGDNVTADQILVRIKSDVQDAQLRDAQIAYNDALQNATPDAPQLLQIQSQIDIARKQLNQDKLNYERYAALRKKNSVSPLDLEKAELQYKTSQANLQILEKNYIQIQNAFRLNANRGLQQVKTQQAMLSEYVVKADKPGIVLDVFKKKGELVGKGEVIAKIGSGKHILKLFVAEDDITKISIGQQVIVQMNNYPDTTFTASIIRILPEFNQTEQSYIAEAVFVNPPKLLLSGTQLQANINQATIRNVLVIPSSALVRGRFVELKDGTERAIKTGQNLGSWVEVKSGLTEQDIILLPKEKKTK